MQQIGGRTGGLDGTEREEDGGWVLDCKRDEVLLFKGGTGAEREGSGQVAESEEKGLTPLDVDVVENGLILLGVDGVENGLKSPDKDVAEKGLILLVAETSEGVENGLMPFVVEAEEEKVS